MRSPIKFTLGFVAGIALPFFAVAQQAMTEDVASIDAIITAVYDVISGDAREARDWERFHSLFAPGATLSPVVQSETGEFQRRIMTAESYVEQNGIALERNGFHEVEIHRVTEVFGQIAHAFSTYESRRTSQDVEPFARGINSFQLMNDGNRWWIVSIYWQAEAPDRPIPGKYGS
jgi:hypothetical protein